ncbi:hypothetical protein L6Q21_02080 [Sandaracinobacter sp. RS1-74]|uniref:hypothetical protein n=1 Tax=Sandaracinobacteroides sayramensis TaxID=2913411 RepID=UPI001EDA5D8C|nr:hypothetical protein [Sandaracinobacteroides sayramensis]MCG2839769.1 hypothetical protein [Sandaracinobacteroides sayramensis]
MQKDCNGPGLIAFAAWLKTRVREPSTWVGLATIAVVLGSDPMQAQGLVQAISLIVGGGLVATGEAGRGGDES